MPQSTQRGRPLEHAGPAHRGVSRKGLFFVGLLYLAFVAYGSLVPLDFRAHSLSQAWNVFLHLPYLELGVASRADWVANIVLYVPLAFFLRGALAGRRDAPASRLFKSALVLAGCVAVAVGVEFVQVFFPPRTVSLNDIIAETLGSAIGIALWHFAGVWLLRLWEEVRAGGTSALRAALVLYVLGYLAFSFFPYDFLVSMAEFSAKLATHRDALFISWHSCASPLRCVSGLTVEIAAAVPLGVLLGMLLKGRARHGLRAALLAGIGLGLAIEGVQLFLASGTAQGVSVLTRAAGTVLGLFLYRRFNLDQMRRLKPYLRPAAVILLLPYLALLTALEGWYSGTWTPLATGLERIPSLHFLPFYYHYYTSEPVALASLVRNVAIYLPLGLAYWGWTEGDGRQAGTGTAALAGGVAGLIIEASKLFLLGQRPDPTNVLLASVGAALAYGAAVWLAKRPAGSPSEPLPARPLGFRLMSLAVLALTAWALADYPLARPWLLVSLMAYGALLLRYPAAWLMAIPALLPVLDLTPWSGWFYLNAFDLFLLLTLGIALWRAPLPAKASLPPGFPLVVGLLAASYLISALVGLLPLQPLDGNAFSSYLSHYNALRVAKGFFFALALLPLVRALDQTSALRRLFVPGMVLGLVSQIMAVLWERLTFSSLLNFGAAYRVSGTFSAMHTGGPFIEAYLVFALPFAALWGLTARGKAVRLASLAVFAGGSYALMVTFARGGYAGFVVALAILAAGVAFWVRRRREEQRPHLLPAALALTAIGIALPIVMGPYAQSRLAQIRVDLDAREQHWQDALAMIDPGWHTRLFGMGLGRFPETYLLKNTHGSLPGNYRFESVDGNGFLRLGAGDGLAMGQIVPLAPHRRYVLSLEVRSPRNAGPLTVHVCLGRILNFRACKVLALEAAGGGRWTPRSVSFDSGELGGARRFLPRQPAEIAFSNPRAGSLIDVDNIRLVAAQGANLVANGDFSRGSAHWFFQTRNYAAWRIENLWLQALFGQGWFGLAALALLTLFLLFRLGRSTARGDIVAACLLAAFAGILTVGTFGSVLDSPRIALLFFLSAWLALFRPAPGAPPEPVPG